LQVNKRLFRLPHVLKDIPDVHVATRHIRVVAPEHPDPNIKAFL